MEVQKTKVVCVTGATGFVASWLVKRLLERGYHVRGTTRDPDNAKKTSHLWELPGAKERLQLFKADLSTDGIFDSIVEGCQGVFHLATPVVWSADDPEKEIVDPTVSGTLNVLKACKKSSTVKRVVYTSSLAAAAYDKPLVSNANKAVDGSSWSSTEFCRQYKLWYAVAKTEAEQAAFEYAKANQLELVSIIPSFIIGYMLPSEPSASAASILQLIKGGDLRFKELPVVHLDDVAQAHILALEEPKASGRYMCSAVDTNVYEVLDSLSKKFPQYNIATKEHQAVAKTCCDSKEIEALGLKFKSTDEMFEDCIRSFQDKGLL